MPILSWLTREQDVKAADKVPYRLLERDDALSQGDPDSGNMLIQGDNLEALKALLPYYRGQVKCIYIDPPYNINAAVGAAFDDNLAHSQWLGTLLPRLQLLEELLADDGIIVASIDDKEGAYLTVLMDEVFGRAARVNIVAVKMSEASGVKMAHAEKRLPKLKEWILIYSKANRPSFSIDLIPPKQWNDEYKTLLKGLSNSDIAELKELVSSDEADAQTIASCNNLLRKSEFESLSSYFKRKEIPEEEQEQWKFENAHRIIQAVGSSSVFTLAKNSKKSGGAISAALSSTGLVYLFKSDFNESAKSPRVQVIFADDNLMTHPGDFWADIKTTGGVGQEGGVLFPNSKKPERLIQRIIGLATERGDLVLDSFLGSGTTAAVAHKMHRRWIGIEMGDHAKTLCVPRLLAVIKGEQSGISEAVEWKGGGGFAFYRLAGEVFAPDGTIAPGIKFAPLAAHIWFAETGTSMAGKATTPFLGAYDGTGIALLYNGILGDKSVAGGNVLTRTTLAIIRETAGDFDGQMIVYGEACRIGPEGLKREGITFKQTPYDVKAR
ncbi:site-specific DNA-methyltransferase (plasmid) [Erythrobacteraceae bacterium WH01K]|nr:site-specific DNA-methyltransferase [Erythrobacteraceae bacterium WH01K]